VGSFVCTQLIGASRPVELPVHVRTGVLIGIDGCGRAVPSVPRAATRSHRRTCAVSDVMRDTDRCRVVAEARRNVLRTSHPQNMFKCRKRPPTGQVGV
jgi:hypothetical protein